MKAILRIPFIANAFAYLSSFTKKIPPIEMPKIIPDKFEEPKYVRKEKYFDKWTDLVGKKCEVIYIIKTISDLYMVYFTCENQTYMLGLDEYPITQNQLLILKCKHFEFVNDKNIISIRTDDKDAEASTWTSMPVWYYDNMRGMVGVHEYIEFTPEYFTEVKKRFLQTSVSNKYFDNAFLPYIPNEFHKLARNIFDGYGSSLSTQVASIMHLAVNANNIPRTLSKLGQYLYVKKEKGNGTVFIYTSIKIRKPDVESFLNNLLIELGAIEC